MSTSSNFAALRLPTMKLSTRPQRRSFIKRAEQQPGCAGQSLMTVAGGTALGCPCGDRWHQPVAIDASHSRPSPDGRGQLLQSPNVTRQQGPLQEPVRDGRGGQPVRAEQPEPQQRPRSHRRRAPDGRGEGAERQPLCHEDGRAGIRDAVDRPALLGRERRPPAQRGFARPLCRSLQRRCRLPGHAALRRPRAHRRRSASAAAAALPSAQPRSTRA